MKTTGYRKRTTLILFFLLLVRFWIGQTFEVSGREAYLWLLGHGPNLDWGYLNTGVLVPWLIRLGTLFFGNTELGVRWLAAVIYSCSGFVIFWCARRWFNPASAFWTMIIFVCTPLYTWQLLLMNEATASFGLMALALLAYREAVNSDKWLWYIAAGAISGLAIHVLWFNMIWPLGLLLYYFIEPRRRQLLRHWQHWVMPVTVLIVSIPIFLWYQRPEMEGLKKLHPLPISGISHGFSLLAGLEFTLTQIWLLSPAFFLGMLLAFYYAGSITFRHHRYALLLCICLPGLLIQYISSFFHAANADAMPALYLPALFLSGNLWASFAQRETRWKWIGVGLLTLAGLQSLGGLIPATSHYVGFGSGLYPPYSYRNLADEMTRRMQEKGATVAVAEDAETASALTFYLPRQQLAYVVARHGVRSQFDFWPNYDDFNGYNFILVTGGNRPAPAIFTKGFFKVDPISDAQIPGSESVGWQLYYCENFQGGVGGTLKDIPAEAVHDLESSTPLPK
ncbi:MAG: hypothetical protein B9S32_15890 [Verrucomicrobia bacterium Tous-C9LFEB]|nr:MAG: hypothetical protein B9S32_15890 [Verrucomicrobia bacterium Tous-C9LFEB]